jgi:hypothetical protein
MQSATKRNNFWIELVGIDSWLLDENATGVRALTRATIVLATVMLVTWVGLWYALYLLFYQILFSAFLSLFFACLFGIIYLFILNTYAVKKKLLLSNFIRIGFVVFIAAIVASSWQVLILSAHLSQRVDQYKQKLAANHLAKLASYLEPEREKIIQRINYCSQQESKIEGDEFHAEKLHLNSKLHEIEHYQKRMEIITRASIESSSFFLYRLQIIYQYWEARILLPVMIIFFVLPGWLIWRSAHQSGYILAKHANDKRLAEQLYEDFSRSYISLFSSRYNARISIFSRFTDSPFNTIKKSLEPAATEEQFWEDYKLLAADKS